MASSARKIASITPLGLVRTSLFQNRVTRRLHLTKPQRQHIVTADDPWLAELDQSGHIVIVPPQASAALSLQAQDARDAGQGLGGTGLLKMLGTAVNLASGQAKRPSIREIPV
jgi:hypothetical protein